MKRLIEIHDSLLQAVADQHDRFKGKELTTFFPIKGNESTGELMVVGRAVNGWSDKSWTADEAAQPNRRAEIIQEVVTTSTKTDCCPMSWVKDNWNHDREGEWEASHSAFFQLSRAVIQSMFGESKNWPSKLIYSNLYKVAPWEGKNPGTRLCTAQQRACEDHLAAEIELWKPKRILFITDWNWAGPFVERLFNVTGEPLPNQVEWSGTVKQPSGRHEMKAVVCIRPRGQKQAPLTESIIRAFSIPE